MLISTNLLTFKFKLVIDTLCFDFKQDTYVLTVPHVKTRLASTSNNDWRRALTDAAFQYRLDLVAMIGTVTPDDTLCLFITMRYNHQTNPIAVKDFLGQVFQKPHTGVVFNHLIQYHQIRLRSECAEPYAHYLLGLIQVSDFRMNNSDNFLEGLNYRCGDIGSLPLAVVFKTIALSKASVYRASFSSRIAPDCASIQHGSGAAMGGVGGLLHYSAKESSAEAAWRTSRYSKEFSVWGLDAQYAHYAKLSRQCLKVSAEDITLGSNTYLVHITSKPCVPNNLNRARMETRAMLTAASFGVSDPTIILQLLEVVPIIDSSVVSKSTARFHIYALLSINCRVDLDQFAETWSDNILRSISWIDTIHFQPEIPDCPYDVTIRLFGLTTMAHDITRAELVDGLQRHTMSFIEGFNRSQLYAVGVPAEYNPLAKRSSSTFHSRDLQDPVPWTCIFISGFLLDAGHGHMERYNSLPRHIHSIAAKMAQKNAGRPVEPRLVPKQRIVYSNLRSKPVADRSDVAGGAGGDSPGPSDDATGGGRGRGHGRAGASPTTSGKNRAQGPPSSASMDEVWLSAFQDSPMSSGSAGSGGRQLSATVFSPGAGMSASLNRLRLSGSGGSATETNIQRRAEARMSVPVEGNGSVSPRSGLVIAYAHEIDVNDPRYADLPIVQAYPLPNSQPPSPRNDMSVPNLYNARPEDSSVSGSMEARENYAAAVASGTFAAIAGAAAGSMSKLHGLVRIKTEEWDEPAAGGAADLPQAAAGGAADLPQAAAGGAADLPQAAAGGAADLPQAADVEYAAMESDRLIRVKIEKTDEPAADGAADLPQDAAMEDAAMEDAAAGGGEASEDLSPHKKEVWQDAAAAFLEEMGVDGAKASEDAAADGAKASEDAAADGAKASEDAADSGKSAWGCNCEPCGGGAIGGGADAIFEDEEEDDESDPDDERGEADKAGAIDADQSGAMDADQDGAGDGAVVEGSVASGSGTFHVDLLTHIYLDGPWHVTC